ncbi:MAG: hypothetical protein LBC70_09715 [Chitinispirillales bacterium]|nr:hypothetical protein [Chitinispirillales bacterium]
MSITATPTSGYGFVNWTLTSGTATFANANDVVTTVTLSSNATIMANFSAPVTLTVNHSPTAGGTVTPTSQSGITVGTPVNISATASSGYEFFNWAVISGAATFANANNAATTVTLSSNATIRANFQLIPGSQFNPNVTYGSFTDSRDGRVYRTVRIGNQTWMAENLNWAGDAGNLGVCYGNNASNCNFYGRLYNWNTVMAGSPSSSSSPSGVQGICPVGWHVPSYAEWAALVNFVGGSSTAGRELKSTIGWNSGGNDADDFGFSALPGGRGQSGGFGNVGISGYWWCATENSASFAWGWHMNSGNSHVSVDFGGEANRFSLRCIMDD